MQTVDQRSRRILALALLLACAAAALIFRTLRAEWAAPQRTVRAIWVCAEMGDEHAT